MTKYDVVAETAGDLVEADAAVRFLARKSVISMVRENPRSREDSMFPRLWQPYQIMVREEDKMNAWILFEQNACIINVVTGETVQERGW